MPAGAGRRKGGAGLAAPLIFPHEPVVAADPPDLTAQREADGSVTLRLTGALVVAHVAAVDAALRGLSEPVARVDLAGVTRIDTVGAWLVRRTAAEHDAEVTHADEDARRLLAALHGGAARAEAAAGDSHLVTFVPALVGRTLAGGWRGVLLLLGFLGELLVASFALLRQPHRIRVKALVRQIELVGVDALAIVGLMSFLIGIVIAQQGAVQLKQFGAEIYTVNLTGRLAFRELGVLMTAIMVAGRSGSAFAAEIGTMKLTEEVDAMRTIGVSPVEALVLPRVAAAMLMLPLLGFYASVAAVIGGAMISSVTLDIPFVSFLMRVQEVVPMYDLWVGLLKGPVFGMIVALTGCFQGMQVRGNSEEVGRRTTQAVVQAIFIVIVLDAFFAVFFSQVGWI